MGRTPIRCFTSLRKVVSPERLRWLTWLNPMAMELQFRSLRVGQAYP